MDQAKQYDRGLGALALWWGVLAGPLAFALDEGLSYAIVAHSCSTGYHWLLHAYTLFALLLAASGFFCAHHAFQQLPSSADLEGGSTINRSRWMAIYGIAQSIAFSVFIIAAAIPKWTMGPCDQ